MEEKILVYYVGVASLDADDIDDYLKKIASKIVPKNFEGEIIMIPTQSHELRIECINPSYISEPELIDKHKAMLNKLLDELHHQASQIKNKKNDN